MLDDTETPGAAPPVYIEKRDSKGRMLSPLPGKHTITHVDASLLAHKRWNNYRRKAAAAIATEYASVTGLGHGGATPGDAWGFVVAKQYTALLDSDRPRGDDLYRMGQVIGAVPLAGELQARAEGGPGPQQVNQIVVVAGAIAERILSRLLGAGADAGIVVGENLGEDEADDGQPREKL